MASKEIPAVLSLGVVMAFRMLGLFMIMPVFSVQAVHYTGSTPFLIGLVLGAYGLTQACFQLPFGALSDRIGRKPVIAFGLLLFVLGSIVAALSTSIWGVIAGRAIQGSGAIGSTCLALVADLTCDENRTKAMASMGMMIGFSFLIAMVLGPFINAHFHLAGIFWFTAILALIAFLILFVIVPRAPIFESKKLALKTVLSNSALLSLDFSIFIQHAIFTAVFIAVPVILTHQLLLSSAQQTLFYIVILVLSAITMVPFVIIAEKKRVIKQTFIYAIGLILLTQVGLLGLPNKLWLVGTGLWLFFAAFTLMESLLPSLVSKTSPLSIKGTAMGVYSTSQFFGIFIGGTLGGLVYSWLGLQAIFGLCAVLALLWLISALGMRQPRYLSTVIMPWPAGFDGRSDKALSLQKLPGVADLAISSVEKLIYIKIDKKIITENELRNVIEPASLSKHN
jgi:MFS family permease